MPTASAPLAVLAEAWLTAKQALESAEQAEKGNSDRARRADLGRWAVVIERAQGRSPADDLPAIARLRLEELDEDVLVAAVAEAKRRWSDATVARMLSTLRGFTRWLYRTGKLATDPLDGDLFRSPPRRERRPKALDAEDYQRILTTAEEAAPEGQWMYWPARDVALVRFLATTGARAEETCGATIGEIDRRAERPIWRVGKAKGDKARDVPLPAATVLAIDKWLAERKRSASAASQRPLTPAGVLASRRARRPPWISWSSAQLSGERASDGRVWLWRWLARQVPRPDRATPRDSFVG